MFFNLGVQVRISRHMQYVDVQFGLPPSWPISWIM